MEMTSEAVKVYNAAALGTDTSFQAILDATGMSRTDLDAGVRWWIENTDDVNVEPESHGRRAQFMHSIMIGGEARHYIRFN